MTYLGKGSKDISMCLKQRGLTLLCIKASRGLHGLPMHLHTQAQLPYPTFNQ